MSCPYFYPQASLPPDGQPAPARIPLGALYYGECHADPAGQRIPHPATAKDYCNFGYGGGSCANFPHDSEADAVRFSISPSRELIWIMEKDFAPVRHGRIGDANTIVRRQAEVFLENYDRYTTRAPGSRVDFRVL